VAEASATTASPEQGLPPFPDFFVVGAPRCGTTSLSHFLNRHPQICFSKPKEPHFFAELGGRRIEGDWRSAYARFFRHYRPDHRAVGEGSVSTLYSEDALRRIRSVNPDVRFVAMVRNPMQMVPSYHQRMLFLLEENVESFARAWDLQEARSQGQHIPSSCLEPRLLLYGEVGRLGDQIQRLRQIGGPERCLVVLFDDLVADPREVYQRVLRFIGIDDDGRTEFPRKQSSLRYRHRWLQRLLYKPPGAVGELLAERMAHSDLKMSKLDRPKKKGKGKRKPLPKRLHKRLRRWNEIVAPPQPLDDRMRRTLQEHFQPDIDKLSGIIQRDLSGWR
jgi:hypothetical protein